MTNQLRRYVTIKFIVVFLWLTTNQIVVNAYVHQHVKQRHQRQQPFTHPSVITTLSSKELHHLRFLKRWVGHMRGDRRLLSLSIILNASNNKISELPMNEFSRTFQTDRILKMRRGTVNSNTNSLAISIEADKTECQALARRFDLRSISNLSATVQIRSSSLNTGGLSSGSIEVEGSCRATVTQRCVRTNDDFDMTLEFPLYCIVKPVIPSSKGISKEMLSSIDTRYQDNNNNKGSKRKNENNGPKKSYRIPSRNMDDLDVMELQRMVQSDMNYDNDVVMEDEAIYCLDGLLDVGELVAQLFWFKLDPYPKKPGTDPIQRSITG